MINKYIREVMEENNMSVNDIVVATGYSIDTVMDIIHHRRMVSPREATTILGVMGIDLWEVLRSY